MRLSVIEATDHLTDLINPDRPEVVEVEDPLTGPMVSFFYNMSLFSKLEQSIRQLFCIARCRMFIIAVT